MFSSSYSNILNGLSPEYLMAQLPSPSVSLYGVRHPNVYRDIFCKSNFYQNSFYPNSIKLWNNLSEDLQVCHSLSTFKKHISSIIKPNPKSIFGIHNPYGISRIFPLRVGLSPLKSHKKDTTFVTH